MNVMNRPVMLDINITWGRVNVDYRPSQEDIKVFDAHSGAKYWADYSQKKGIEGIGEIANRGYRLGRIETGHTISDEARIASHPRTYNVDVGFMRGPEINIEENRLSFNILPRGKYLNVFR